MLGYCSNSFLRCNEARALTLLNQDDNCCPECGFFLVPANSALDDLKLEQRYLYFSLLAMAGLLMILVYIYYRKFV